MLALSTFAHALNTSCHEAYPSTMAGISEESTVEMSDDTVERSDESHEKTVLCVYKDRLRPVKFVADKEPQK